MFSMLQNVSEGLTSGVRLSDEKAAGSLQAIQALLRTIKGEAVDATEASAQLRGQRRGRAAKQQAGGEGRAAPIGITVGIAGV